MRSRRRGVPFLMLCALVVLVVSGAPAQAQDLLPLADLPGLNAARRNVGAAIDIICPELSRRQSSLTSAQRDLLARCADMKVKDSAGQVPLGNSNLPDVLLKVTSDGTPAQGRTVIETRSSQLRSVGTRLSALRLGATGVSLSGLKLDDGQTISAGQLLGLPERGGGASADPDLYGRFGVFLNGVGNFGSRDSTADEVGFDFHTVGATGGADYRITDNLVAGLAFTYLRTDADTNFSLGEVGSNSYGFSLYGTYYVGSLYVDLLAGFTWYNYDTTRRIVYGAGSTAVDRTAKGDTDGWQYTLNGGAGYDFKLGGTTLTPFARVEYLNLQIDGFSERGSNGLDLQIRKQTVESLVTVLGGRIAHAISTPFAVLIPHLRLEWRHEYLNDSRSITAKFVNDPFGVFFTIPTENPDRDYFALGAGVAAALKKGVAAFLDYETVIGLRDITTHNFTAGVRVQF